MKAYCNYFFILLLGASLASPFIHAFENKARKVECNCTQFRSFGSNWSVCRKLYDHIRFLLPEGETLLELGSGWASGELSKIYTVWSVEHDELWLGKYPTHYIYAPIVNGWYSQTHLKEALPFSYSLILVDGPPGAIGRGKFFDNIDLFNTEVPIIFDDVNRADEYQLMVKVAQKLDRPFYTISCGDEQTFGVIPKAEPSNS